MSEKRLKIAIQKSGRLAGESLELLEKCGIRLTRSKDQLFCRARNFPLDAFFVRDDDIPAFVANDVAQIGIVGENVLAEEKALDGKNRLNDVRVLNKLGFGTCRLSIAVPHDFDYKSARSLKDLTIATSYKGVLQAFLNKNDINADIVSMKGAVEVAPRIGMADCICDLVSTGATLSNNGLKEEEIILQSQSILIGKDITDPEIQNIFKRFMLRLEGVQKAKNSKYIMLHCPPEKLEDVKAVLPGADSPTVLNLEGRDDLVAVHSVAQEGVFWDTMENLRDIGASDILVVPIEKILD